MSGATEHRESAVAASRQGEARASTRRSNIEVVIPTFNEEENLPHALRSVVDWADHVYVVDSKSRDRTRQIAEEMGATVVVQEWLGYAKQKNWALDNLPLESDWVFILDADESITPELREELLEIASKRPTDVHDSGFYVNRLTYFLGRPLRHCGYFPSYNLRFFKRGRARYEDREVHEHMIVDGPTRRLRHMMLHEDRRGLEHFIAKHNRYSTLEARELMRMRVSGGAARPSRQRERGIALRRWLKYHVRPWLPFAGLWRFLYMYFVRLGFLDGMTGLRFCVLLSTYETFITLKHVELSHAGARRNPSLLDQPASTGLAIPEGEVATATVAKPAKSDDALQRLLAEKPKAPAVEVAPEAAASEERDIERREGRPIAEPRDPRTDRFEQELEPNRLPPGQWPSIGTVPVSVLIPVKNEQQNLIGCLRRLRWANEIIVVDSQSTDATRPIAQAMGASVYQFHYSKEGWPKKKNWALEHVPWKNEWVLILDADEYMTPELAGEVERVVRGRWQPVHPSKAGCGDGFWINRRFMFMGKWIRGCGYYPSWNVRLFKHAVGRYERIGSLGDTGSGDNEVHEHVTLKTGEPGFLKEEFLHYAYPDLSAWIEKHNRYTTWEAHAMTAGDKGDVHASIFGSPIERRRWMKRLSRGLPFRPSLRFLYGYFVRYGFRDGYAGFIMCRLLAWYELMSIAKYREMRTPNAQCSERNR